MLNVTSPPLDARCILIVLILSNIITFTQNALWIELSFLIFLEIVLSLCGCKKQAYKWLFTFIFIIIIQYFILPKIEYSFVSGFAVIFVYARKILPCIILGTIIVKKIPFQYLILALHKFKFPKSVIIPLAVTIRYIPSIHEESRQIKDAMKLRKIHGIKRIEYTLVPLIMSAINTADELSAAAVTRGIENPCKKTSIFSMRFTWKDYLVLIITICFTVFALLTKGGLL